MITKLGGWLYLGACIIAVIFVAGVISDIVMSGTFIPERLLAALVIWTMGRAAKFVLAGEYSESTAWNRLKSRFWDVETRVLGAPELYVVHHKVPWLRRVARFLRREHEIAIVVLLLILLIIYDHWR